MTPDQEKRVENIRRFWRNGFGPTAIEAQDLLAIVDAQAARIKELEEALAHAETVLRWTDESVKAHGCEHSGSGDCTLIADIESARVAVRRAISGPPKTQGG